MFEDLRKGYFPDANLSKLNISDTEINKNGVFNRCQLILYTNPDMSSKSVVSLNTSDKTNPRLIKSEYDEDVNDNYIFTFVSSGDGYLIQSNKGGYFLTVTNNDTIIGQKDAKTIWKFASVGGKNKITTKLFTELNNKKLYMFENNSNIDVSDNPSINNSQWNVGFYEFGDTAFNLILKLNPYLIKQCCDNKLSDSLIKVCKDNKFIKGNSSCDTQLDILYDVYDNDVDEMLDLQFSDEDYGIYEENMEDEEEEYMDQIMEEEEEEEEMYDTDASGIGIGMMLSQLDDQGRERPIAFESRKLRTHEKGWDTTNQEAAIMIKNKIGIPEIFLGVGIIILIIVAIVLSNKKYKFMTRRSRR